MINNLDKDSKKPNFFLLSIPKADFRDLFWEKQSLNFITFIVSNFFLNSSGQKARLSPCWLSQLTSQESSESDLSLRLCGFFCSLYSYGTHLPLLTLSGPGGGGGSEARMAKLTAANQKPLILWCLNLVTFSFYPWDTFWPHFSKIGQPGGCCCSFLTETSQKFWKWKMFPMLENCWNLHGGSILGREERFWT